MECVEIIREGITYQVLYGTFDNGFLIKVCHGVYESQRIIPLNELEEWKKTNNLYWRIPAIILNLIKTVNIQSIHEIYKDVDYHIKHMKGVKE